MNIFFNQELHKYTDINGFVYTPVTTLINKFNNEFDAKFWLKAKAVELFYIETYGDSFWYRLLNDYRTEHKQDAWKKLIADVEKEYDFPDLTPYMLKIQKKWKDKTNEAIDTGNEKHKFFEDSINKSLKIGIGKEENTFKAITVTDIFENRYRYLSNNTFYFKKWKDQYPKIYKAFINYVTNGYKIYSEIVTYSHLYKVCGTVDVPIFNFVNETFYIEDWKSNEKELKTEAGYYKKINGEVTNMWIRTYERMKYPLSNLEQCDINTYTLQLSLYAYMIEALTGFRCLGLVINHINSEGEKRIDIPYLKKEAKMMLTYKEEDDTVFAI